MEGKFIRVRCRPLKEQGCQIFDIIISQEEFDGMPVGKGFTTMSNYLQPLVEKIVRKTLLSGSVEYQGLVPEIYANCNLIPGSTLVAV